MSQPWQCGPVRRKDAEQQPLAAFPKKELLITSACVCRITVAYICTMAQSSLSLCYKLRPYVVSFLIKLKANSIKVKPIHHAMSENGVLLLTQQSILAAIEWPVNMWLYYYHNTSILCSMLVTVSSTQWECRCTLSSRWSHVSSILFNLYWVFFKRRVLLEHKWRTKFPSWIGPFTDINWIDAKDPRGAENCSAMDENPFRAVAPTSSQDN